MGLKAVPADALDLGASLPTIDTPRLRLRGLTRADARALFTVFGDAEVTRYWSRPPMTTIAEAEALVDEIEACFTARTLLQWGVARREDDQVIGTCTLARLDVPNRRAEIGYALARSTWGHGLATEAVIAALGFAFEGLELHRIEADVDPRNTRSLDMLERIGFLREGYLPERYFVGGEVQDAVLLGLLRPRWTLRHSRSG